MNDARQYVARYNDASLKEKEENRRPEDPPVSPAIQFVTEPPRQLLDEGTDWEAHVFKILAEALEDGLSESLRRVQGDIHNEVAELLETAVGVMGDGTADPPAWAASRHLVDFVRRTVRRDWVFDLYLNGREVEALTNRLVRDHGRLFREAQQKIRSLDGRVRELLRENIPELARMRIWFRLPGIEENLRQLQSPSGPGSLVKAASAALRQSICYLYLNTILPLLKS